MDNKDCNVPFTPTKAMIEAGENKMTAIPPHPAQDIVEIWQAMIEAYKSENKK